MRLNGWRRAFVLIAALWGLYAGYAYLGASNANRALYLPDIEAARDSLRAFQRIGDTVGAAQAESSIVRTGRYLDEANTNSALVQLLGWALPLLTLYALGSAIAWVRRGFL